MLDAPRNANSKTQMGGGGEATGQDTQDPPLTNCQWKGTQRWRDLKDTSTNHIKWTLFGYQKLKSSKTVRKMWLILRTVVATEWMSDTPTPTPIHILDPKPQCAGIRRWGLGEALGRWLGREDRALLNGQVRTQWKDCGQWVRNQILTWHQTCWLLHLGLPSNLSLLFVSHAVYEIFVIAAQTKIAVITFLMYNGFTI